MHLCGEPSYAIRVQFGALAIFRFVFPVCRVDLALDVTSAAQFGGLEFFSSLTAESCKNHGG